ncbi:MAG: site-2 protease family protein, partial [Planctomycetes bacterium]|nr:site-2 protease family protein [Planctomycetota bacterium]
MDLVSILISALGIGLLIFVHELGHFLAARMAGVRVEVFSLGFGPRVFGFQWRDTDFRLSAVPFGGFVVVAGADPSDRRYPRHESLYAKSIPQRALFWSAGVMMNVLFALVAFPIVFSAGVDFEAPIIGSVGHGSAAWEAELQPGDRVVRVDGREVLSFNAIVTEVALHGHHPLGLLVERDGQELAIRTNPRYDDADG